MKKIILTLLVTTGYCSAAVSVAQGFVQDLRGETLAGVPSIGNLVLIVASTADGDNTFDNILAGDSFTVGSTIGGGDDIIIATRTVQDAGGGARFAQGAFTEVDLVGNLTAGDSYALYWFDSATTGVAEVNSRYGFARNADWLIPTEGSTENGSNIVPSQLAAFTVQPVPEPSSVALVGLGSLALLTRRRKK